MEKNQAVIFTKDVTLLVFCAVFTLGNHLTYQVFLGQGLEIHLKIHFIISLLPNITNSLSLMLGHSLLIILPKEKGREKEFFSSALLLSSVFALIALVVMFATQNFFLNVYEIYSPLSSKYYSFIMMATFIMAINITLNYFLVFHKKVLSVFKVNLFTLIIGLLGNFFCLFLFNGEERLLSYGLVKVMVAILTLFCFFYYVFPMIEFNLTSPLKYLKRARKILFGDTLGLVVVLLFPSVINFILVKYNYEYYISTFGVAMTIIAFISIPSAMTIIYATPIMSRYKPTESNFPKLVKKIKKLVWKNSLFPAMITLLLLAVFSKLLWGFDFFPLGAYLFIVGLIFIPISFGVPYMVINRSLEKQLYLAKVIFLERSLILSILFVLVYFRWFDLYFYGFSLLIIALIKFFFIKRKAKQAIIFTK